MVMSGGLASSGVHVVLGLSGVDLIVDLLVGIVIFVVVVVVAAVLMALLQAVLPGGSSEAGPQEGAAEGDGGVAGSQPGVPAEVGQHPLDGEARERDAPGSDG